MVATLETLIKRMKDRGILMTPKLEEAFRQVDRCHFVPTHLKGQAYADHPLAIGAGQTISQPSTVAYMLELLQVEAGNQVLDVGAGSCWTTALLAHLVGEGGRVIALERIGALANFGRQNLTKGCWPQAEVYHANGWHGWESAAPYHRILVSAAASHVPEALIHQLKPGGILVMPLSDWGGSMLRLCRKMDGSLTRETQGGFAFVPFVEADEMSE